MRGVFHRKSPGRLKPNLGSMLVEHLAGMIFVTSDRVVTGIAILLWYHGITDRSPPPFGAKWLLQLQVFGVNGCWNPTFTHKFPTIDFTCLCPASLFPSDSWQVKSGSANGLSSTSNPFISFSVRLPGRKPCAGHLAATSKVPAAAGARHPSTAVACRH